MKKNLLRDTFVAGLTLFAMFLGAGNIIFPPSVGVNTGSSWLIAAIGFVITGAGLPLLGTLTLSKLGGNADNISKRAWPRMGSILNVVIIVMIGPLFAIPRTAATTCEMSVLPFIGSSLDSNTVFIITSFVFFLITYLLSISQSKVMDSIGGVLSPLLIVFLFITIALSIITPIGTPAKPLVEDSLFYFGFSQGYLTMDGIGSLVMSGTIASFILNKGYSKEETKKMLPKSALIAGILLSIVYFGYTWIGASGSQTLGALINNRPLLLSSASLKLAGKFGQILLGAIIFFACLTTSSGLTVTFAQYFNKLSNGKISYRFLVIFAVVSSFLISLIGVEGIIQLSVPILEVIYPICIVLIALHMLGRFVKYDESFKGALIGTFLVCPLIALDKFPTLKNTFDHIINSLPLGKEGFIYLPPAFIGFVIGTLWGYMKKSKSTSLVK